VVSQGSSPEYAEFVWVGCEGDHYEKVIHEEAEIVNHFQ
jgi:hypothetical protein